MADRENHLGNLANSRPPSSGVGSQGASPFDSGEPQGLGEQPSPLAGQASGGPMAGLMQADGNQSSLGTPPTRGAALQPRGVNTRNAGGLDGAMSDMADKMHPAGRRR